MDLEYIIVNNHGLLPYLHSKKYFLELEKYGLTFLQTFSYAELQKMNAIIYVYDNNQLVTKAYQRPTWNLFNKKFKQFLSMSDYELLKNNYYCIINNILYKFTNITDNIRCLTYIINHQKCMHALNVTLQYLKQITFELDYFLKIYHVISDKIEWFDYSNKHINYENIEHIEKVQKSLIDNGIINTFKNISYSWLDIDWWTFRGWTVEYAKQQISKIQQLNSNKWQTKLHTNPEKYLGLYSNQIEYWLKKGYNEKESRKKVSERQSTFTLKKCIEKYGETEGVKRFQERQIKWQKTLTSKDDYLEIVYARTAGINGCSHISQDLFDNINKRLNELHIDVKQYYKTLNHEWGTGIKGYGGFLYDYVIPDLKYAIEFNGERFHPRIDSMSDDEFKKWKNPWGATGEQIFERDYIKNKTLRDKGFILDIVWNADYIKNKEQIITDIVNKIKKIWEQKNQQV